MTTQFTEKTLPDAVRSLFQLNNYEVSGSTEVHGAEVDLTARSRTDPFAPPIYIEVTIEYVDNTKYGKDLTKLVMFQNQNPSAQCLIVSSAGFSNPVRERATIARVQTYTYDELFAKFEQFGPYLNTILGDTELGRGLALLDRIYEEPLFRDKQGNEVATTYLNGWRESTTADNRWLIVTGDYGTGKTALTRVLLRRWAADYRTRPALPIPFRIELRDFTRQFDARNLLHHFLDHNRLGHIPVDFVSTLIRQGRVVLLLDGYDEMAQYMHLRERRVCLEALAQLAADGARGLLTSRPNYFSEAEELHVFEHLYAALPAGGRHLASLDKPAVEQEQQLDEFLRTQVIERRERTLQDLTPEQTEALVARALKDDPEGRAVVLSILQRVFRESAGEDQALSGKPVIINYLIELAEELKKEPSPSTDRLTEWAVYRLIIDRLMARDHKRSPNVAPSRRRLFLQRLSVQLSQRSNPVVDEEMFRQLIRDDFKTELRRAVAEEREQEVERLFADLRSSATLTRASDGRKSGWRFSHNSLREFLAAEALIRGLESGQPIAHAVPVTDPMRAFVASHRLEEVNRWLLALATLWPQRLNVSGLGQLLTLLWDAGLKVKAAEVDPVRAVLRTFGGDAAVLSGLTLERFRLPQDLPTADLSGATFADSQLSDCDLSRARLRSANFQGVIAENLCLAGADLQDADFTGSLLFEVDLSDATVTRAKFATVAALPMVLVTDPGTGGRQRLEGYDALGYLQFAGAITGEVPAYYVYRHHPDFPVVEKVCRKLADQEWRQVLGLVQKGAARQDPKFARQFLDFLIASGLVQHDKNRDLARATADGRDAFTRLLDNQELVPALVEHLASEWDKL